MAQQAPEREERLWSFVLLGGVALISLVALVVVAYGATAAAEGGDIGAALGRALAALWRVGGALAGVGVVALLVLRFLPAFMVRYDRKVTALEAYIVRLEEHGAEQERAFLRANSARVTAEARLESAGALITELRAERDQWKAAAHLHALQRDDARRELDYMDKRATTAEGALDKLVAERDEARAFARSAARSVDEERSAPPTLLGVVAFLRDLKALEKRSARAVPPLFRKHVGAAGNSPATFAAVRELLELLDERAGEGAARGTEQAEHAERSAEQGA